MILRKLIQKLISSGTRMIKISKPEFIKEHRHLVELLNRYDYPDLKKESKSQSAELKKLTGKKA